MASFYADESLPLEVIEALRGLGHDVLTALEAGQANKRIPDQSVLEFATRLGRTVLTLNQWDFVRLHSQMPKHMGIVTCTQDADGARQAAAIDRAVREVADLRGNLLRINRPG